MYDPVKSKLKKDDTIREKEQQLFALIQEYCSGTDLWGSLFVPKKLAHAMIYNNENSEISNTDTCIPHTIFGIFTQHHHLGA